MIKAVWLVTIAFMLTAASSTGFADVREFVVFGVKRSFPMSEHDPIYRDYYVNFGSDEGSRPGMVIDVYRRVPVIDTLHNKVPGDMVVAVAKLKVIYAQTGLSVGRLYKVASASSIPVTDDSGIMMGDRIEIARQQPFLNKADDNGSGMQGATQGGSSAESRKAAPQGLPQPQPQSAPEPTSTQPETRSQQSQAKPAPILLTAPQLSQTTKRRRPASSIYHIVVHKKTHKPNRDEKAQNHLPSLLIDPKL